MDGQERRGSDGPPEDAESWTDEEWIAWLEATDDSGGDVASSPVGSRHWSRRRPAGLLGAAMLGLHEAIYGRHDDEIVIVADAGGDPPGDDFPEVHLDPEHPERSEVIVRRHPHQGGSDPPVPSGPA